MAQSIGDLCINLGFNVDKQKLDDFNDSVNSTFQGILKFAGLDLGIQGLAKIGMTAAQSALWMRDLNVSFGTSYEWMQKFQGQWAFFHPGEDPNAVQGVERHVAEYQARMRRGEGGGEAAVFGIEPSDSLDQMFQKMQRQIPLLLKSGRTLGQLTELAAKIFGDPNIMVMLQASDKQLENAGHQLELTEQQRIETVEAAQALNTLHLAWDNFTNHIVATLAEVVNDFNKKPQYKDFSDYKDQRGWGGIAWDALAGGAKTLWGGAENSAALLTIGMQELFGGKGSADAMINSYRIMNRGAFGFDNNAGQLPWASGGGGGRKQQAIAYFMSQGHSQAQAEGIVAGLMKEDATLDPRAINPASGAEGIMQLLSKNRLADFKAHEGVAIRDSTFEQQLDFIEWELRNTERKAGKLLEQTQTKEQAERVWKDSYERSTPITNHNTINVYGPGDPHEAARATVQGIVEITAAQYGNTH